MDEYVKKLLEKATEQKEAHHAMNFAQAALNAAHTLQVLVQTEGAVMRAGGNLVFTRRKDGADVA